MKKAPTPPRSKGSPLQKLVPAFLLAIIITGIALLIWPKTRPPSRPAEPAEANPTNSAEAGVLEQTADPLKAILGSWLREDGGYRLELKSVESDGRLNAAYFNPRPINVSYASATNDGSQSRLQIELNDVGYPGCVYKLVYDRTNDRLIGTYLQAALQQTYEVMFVRLP